MANAPIAQDVRLLFIQNTHHARNNAILVDAALLGEKKRRGGIEDELGDAKIEERNRLVDRVEI